MVRKWLIPFIITASFLSCGSDYPSFFALFNSWPGDIQETIREFEAHDEMVVLTPRKQIPVVINGLNERGSGVSVPPNVKPIPIDQHFNVIVVGAGMAGLTAALTVVNEGLSVLLLEKEAKVGGLATGGTRGGNEFGSGSAYQSPLIPEQEPIYRLLGLQRYEKENAIHHPSDTLFIPGGVAMKDGSIKYFFLDFWEDDEVINELPVGFALTRWAHFHLNNEGKIPNQPIENAESEYDKMTYEEFLHTQYDLLVEYVKKNNPENKKKEKEREGYKEAKALLDRIHADIKSGKEDPVITEKHKGLVDPVIRYYAVNYGHSAKGGSPNVINAASGLNFFFSEMTTRYTYPHGTGEVSKRTELLIRFKPKLATFSTNSYVESIEETNDRVLVVFVREGRRYVAESDKVIFSAPLNLAPKIIKNLNTLAPEHARIIAEYEAKLQSTDYVVIPLFIEGHPSVVKMTYDLWVGQEEFSLTKPTDFISGEWMKYAGYTKKIPDEDKVSVITIYHPMGATRPHNQEELLDLIEDDIDYMKSIYDPVLKANNEPPIKVRFAEINLWPRSIVIPRVNHFANAKVLAKPVGQRIHFGVGGWMGTPSHEEAQYRGWRAGKEVADALKAQRVGQR